MKKYRKYIVLIILISAIALAFHYDLHKYITTEQIEKLVDRSGVFGPLVFIALYFVASLLFLPATLLSILSGLLFGKLLGSVYVVVAATLSGQASVRSGTPS